jgi:hypothetical protein
MSENLLIFRRQQQESIIWASLLFSLGFELQDENYYGILERSKISILENLNDVEEIDLFIVEIEEVKTEVDNRILTPLSSTLINDLDRYLEIVKKRKSICQRRIVSAKRIQKSWRHVISDPEYQVCKNRLNWEFNDYAVNTPCSIT